MIRPLRRAAGARSSGVGSRGAAAGSILLTIAGEEWRWVGEPSRRGADGLTHGLMGWASGAWIWSVRLVTGRSRSDITPGPFGLEP